MAWRLGVNKPESEPAAEEIKPEQPIDILDRPMRWGTFKSLTKEQQIEYIKRLMDKYDVPGKALGEMFGVHPTNVTRLVREFGIGSGEPRPRRAWKKDEFWTWVNGTEFHAGETPVTVTLEEDVGKEASEIIEELCKEANPANESNETPHLTEREKEHLDRFVQDLRELSAEVAEGAKAKKKPAEIKPMSCVPIVPRMGNMNFVGDADDILTTLRTLLGGARVNLTVSWDIVSDSCCHEEV